MTSLMDRLAREVSFSDVEGEVHGKIWEFYQRYRIDLELLRSEAFVGYCLAYETYNQDYGAFTTWVSHKVTSKLMDTVRRECKKRRLTRVDADLESVECPWCFNLDDWMKELSEDAQQVVSLVFKPPIDVTFSMRQLGGENPSNFRQAVREFLIDLGWTTSRIGQTFKEIRGAL